MDDMTRDPQSKLRHIEACLTRPVEYLKTTGFESYELQNEALPELSLASLDLSCELAGRKLRAPLMIAPMTGGTERGRALNRRLAAAAERFGLAMGVGSQRIAVEDPSLAEWFQVRDVAPGIPLFANLGAAQLARGYGAEEARRTVVMIGADALFVHFNPVQEAVQGGNRDFRGIARRLEELCRDLGRDGIPVFAREVCFGMTEATARRLLECGVSGIDCSGAGGTSWAKVEAHCAPTAERRELGLRFGEWGIPTAESIRNVRRAAPDLPLIASGGLRSGTDVAKAIALGADVGAMARPFLVKADEGEEPLHGFIEELLADLRICMFATGSGTVPALRGKLRPSATSVPSDLPGGAP
jgi:isopentenyl-diphosphate Delta-isomerase